MSFQSGGYNDAIGRISAHIEQITCPSGYCAGDGNIVESFIQQLLTPLRGVHISFKPALLLQHTDFPN